MKISHEKQSYLVRELYYPDLASRPCIHGVSLLCWLLMIILGATLIGAGTTNNSTTYPFCSDS